MSRATDITATSVEQFPVTLSAEEIDKGRIQV